MRLMRLRLTRFTFCAAVVYLLLSAYAAYCLFWDRSTEDAEKDAESQRSSPSRDQGQPTAQDHGRAIGKFPVQQKPQDFVSSQDWDFSLNDLQQPDPPDTEEEVRHQVEVWGKAAIGDYLWKHIFGADVEPKLDGMWSLGKIQIKDVQYTFRTGPGVVPDRAPADIENLVLILNGREPKKVALARIWLDYLPQYGRLKNVGVILLGNEECRNDWIAPYLTKNGGLVKFVFIVYDCPQVDDVQIYQWPLGVATYRKFPTVDLSTINTQRTRYFKCNFLGTVYPNSSRTELLKILEDPVLFEKCYVKPRMEWWPQETPTSQAEYIRALLQSDLTLSPVGKNAESYRIYEAMSYGSVPVLEDVVTPGKCAAQGGPLRLLKQYKAPVIYVKNWSEVVSLIKKDLDLSPGAIVARRQNVVEWYISFRQTMKERFVKVLNKHFFQS